MTTRVTVTTVDWPVKITHIDKPQKRCAGPKNEEIIPPNSERTVYIHSNRDVRVEELPAK